MINCIVRLNGKKYFGAKGLVSSPVEARIFTLDGVMKFLSERFSKYGRLSENGKLLDLDIEIKLIEE